MEIHPQEHPNTEGIIYQLETTFKIAKLSFIQSQIQIYNKYILTDDISVRIKWKIDKKNNFLYRKKKFYMGKKIFLIFDKGFKKFFVNYNL